MVLAAAAAGYMVARQLQHQVPALQGGTALPQPRSLTRFELTDHRGQAFGTDQLAGMPSLVFFGFTHCPDVCPTTLAMMAQLSREPALNGLRMLFITVDPGRDDQAALQAYVEAFGPQLTGLRGEDAALDPLLQGIGVGFVFVPLSAIAFATLPKALSAEAAGVYSLIRSIGSSIGISIVSVALSRGAQASWGALRSYVDPYRFEVQQYLDPLHLKAQGAGLALIAKQTAVQAQMLGLLQAFWLIVASFFVMVPLVMLLRPGRGGPAPAVAMAE